MHISSPNLPLTATNHGQTYTDLIGKKEEEDGMAKGNSNATVCDTKSILGVCKPTEMEEEEEEDGVRPNAMPSIHWRIPPPIQTARHSIWQ